jgi:hypothetical protein
LQQLQIIDVFSFQNQFWFLAAYLVGFPQRITQLIVTNLRHSKLLLNISSYIQHERHDFPKSSSNFLLALLYDLSHFNLNN